MTPGTTSGPLQREDGSGPINCLDAVGVARVPSPGAGLALFSMRRCPTLPERLMQCVRAQFVLCSVDHSA